MHADDTQILVSYQLDNQQNAATMLQSDLMALEFWMVKNHLTTKTAKTQVITFGSRPQLKKVAADIANSLRIEQSNLKRINEVRNLGGDGHQPVMAETHKTIKLKDELSSDTACTHKISNIKI